MFLEGEAGLERSKSRLPRSRQSIAEVLNVIQNILSDLSDLPAAELREFEA